MDSCRKFFFGKTLMFYHVIKICFQYAVKYKSTLFCFIFYLFVYFVPFVLFMFSSTIIFVKQTVVYSFFLVPFRYRPYFKDFTNVRSMKKTAILGCQLCLTHIVVYINICFTSVFISVSWYDLSPKVSPADKEADTLQSIRQYYAFIINGVRIFFIITHYYHCPAENSQYLIEKSTSVLNLHYIIFIELHFN